MNKLIEYLARYRDALDSITTDYVVLVSKSSSDGGKAGVLSEAARVTAAHRIADNSNELANEEQTAQYYAEQKAAREAAELEAYKERTKFAYLTPEDRRKLDELSGRKK